MSAQDNGGPAFPTSAEQSHNGISAGAGMTLRDYFAGKAMQALISATRTTTFDAGPLAYEIADTMLKAGAAS